MDTSPSTPTSTPTTKPASEVTRTSEQGNGEPIAVAMWGTGGQARVVEEFLGAVGCELVVVCDHDPHATWESETGGTNRICHGWSGFEAFLPTFASESGGRTLYGIVAVGGHDGSDRLRIQARMETLGVRPIAVVHPSAYVASNAMIGPGSQVMAQSAVCALAKVGRGCLINTGSSVDHHCELGDGVHVAPGARLAGGVRVGEHTMVGMGAMVLPRIKIGNQVVIGAGAVVTHDVPDGKVVYGNPARVVKDVSRLSDVHVRGIGPVEPVSPAQGGGAKFLVEGKYDIGPATEE